MENVDGRGIIGSPEMHKESASKFLPRVPGLLESGELLPMPFKVAGGLDKVGEGIENTVKASGYKLIIHLQE
jgi:hypothetical protein